MSESLPVQFLSPHHDGSALYVPNSSPSLDDVVPVFLRAPISSDVERVHLRQVIDGEPSFSEAVIDRVTATDTWWRADLRCHNPVSNYRWLLIDRHGNSRWLNARGMVDWDITDRHDFAVTTHAPAPEWASKAVFYQIFPDRFAPPVGPGLDGPVPPWAHVSGWADPAELDGPGAMTQLYGGSLRGVISKLSHLCDLGVNTVWITPWFPANSNHRYDASSFDSIDPVLGGDDALTDLSRALHERGMRLLGDLTLNHTGAAHDWFLKAQADETSDEAGFYYFLDHPDSYESWIGVPSLPKLDHTSAELRRRFYEGTDSVAARWLKPPFDLDGWRIDVANMTGRLGPIDINHDIAAAVRATVEATRPDGLLIGEHAHDATSDLDGSGWHGTMNYAGFSRPMWSWLRGTEFDAEFLGVPARVSVRPASAVAETMKDFMASVPWQSAVSNMNILGSHDTARWRTVAGDAGRAKVGTAMLFTFPGTPCVFAGDEIGMTGADNHSARSPFPWQDQDHWDKSIFDHYRSLTRLRRQTDALANGGLRWLSTGDDHMTFARETPDETVIVHAARAAHSAVALDAAGLGIEKLEHLYGDAVIALSDGRLEISADESTVGIYRFPTSV